MACIINASTTSGLVQTADLSGNLQLQWNGQAAPAFSAYLGTNQNITASTYTKIQINTEEFDTNNNFDNATNYRFTPTVAGYYQVTGQVYPNTTTSFGIAAIYKNGSNFKAVQTSSASVGVLVTALVYLNGSTDYIELYGYLTGVTPQVYAALQYTYFQACLVRGA